MTKRFSRTTRPTMPSATEMASPSTAPVSRTAARKVNTLRSSSRRTMAPESIWSSSMPQRITVLSIRDTSSCPTSSPSTLRNCSV